MAIRQFYSTHSATTVDSYFICIVEIRQSEQKNNCHVSIITPISSLSRYLMQTISFLCQYTTVSLRRPVYELLACQFLDSLMLFTSW